jgi:hypothetical protein
MEEFSLTKHTKLSPREIEEILLGRAGIEEVQLRLDESSITQISASLVEMTTKSPLFEFNFREATNRGLFSPTQNKDLDSSMKQEKFMPRETASIFFPDNTNWGSA